MRPALDANRLLEVYRRVARRYDLQHTLLTFRADQRGRKLLVRSAVREGDRVLDAGAGTGSTGLLAARRAGPTGHVVLFDQNDDMLAVAREKARASHLADRVAFRTGDMVCLPFDDDTFDVVLSTYSMCPLYSPADGARELYRVLRPGGRLGVAHSTEPANPVVRWLADKVESLVWRFPSISLGCRAVSVLPALERAGARLVIRKVIGIPLWPFVVFVVEKPA